MYHLSLLELLNKIDSWETNSKEVFDLFLQRIHDYNTKLWAFISADREWFHQSNAVLQWLPIWVKDIFAQKNTKTQWASIMLQDFQPPYDATVIQKLKTAWMSSIWNLNMDEFAMGSSTKHSAILETKNPWWNNRIPGGSSGWSAAAVAAWLCPAALGTDTWGSLRQPASLCWVVGFRPSYWRNSRFWVFPMASSFDVPGTITKTVRDAWVLYDIMNGEDEFENTSLTWKHLLPKKLWDKKDLQWIKVWVPAQYFADWLEIWVKETIQTAIQELQDLWAKIIDVSLPLTKYAIAAYYIIVPAEVSTNLARYDGIRYGHMSAEAQKNLDELYLKNRGEWLGDESQKRSVVGSYVLSSGFYDAYFMKAAKVRTRIIQEFNEVFEQVDVIIGPASPRVAWKLDEVWQDPLQEYLADMYTVPSSLAGLPGISVPCGFAKSDDTEQETLPVGLQIISQRLNEETLLQVAHVYEESTWWSKQMIPPNYK